MFIVLKNTTNMPVLYLVLGVDFIPFSMHHATPIPLSFLSTRTVNKLLHGIVAQFAKTLAPSTDCFNRKTEANYAINQFIFYVVLPRESH